MVLGIGLVRHFRETEFVPYPLKLATNDAYSRTELRILKGPVSEHSNVLGEIIGDFPDCFHESA
jgi:hypothetical protein